MKRILSVLMAVLLTVFFVSCSNPSGGDSGSNAGDVNKTELLAAINTANTLNAAHAVGAAGGNVPQTAKDAYAAAIASAKTVADDASATQAQVDDALSALKSATVSFNASIIVSVTYLYASDGSAAGVTSSIDAWSSGTSIDSNYASDATYAHAISLASGSGWGANVSCVAFTGIPAGKISEFESIRFKIKTTDYTSITVKVPSVEKTYDLSSGTALSGGWVQMVIPLSDFGTTPASSTEMGIFNNTAGKAGSMLLTDVGFSGKSATVVKDGLNAAITAATALNTAHVVGTDDSNVAQTAKDAYIAAIAAAQTVADNASATQAQVNDALAALNAATASFNAAIIVLGPTSLASAPSWTNDKVSVIYSSGGAYTNSIAVSEWSQNWWHPDNQSAVAAADYAVSSSNVKKYSNLSGGASCGIVYTNFDATTQKNFHADVYALSGTKVNLKIVCSGGGVTLIPVTLTPGSWTSVNLDLSTATGLTKRDALFQIGVIGEGSSDAANVIYIDNILFHE